MKLDTDINERAEQESEVSEMKEGDYLRQGIVLDDVTDDDDDDVKKSGCLAHRSRSATFDSPGHHPRHSGPSHHNKLAEKLLRFFRPHTGGSGRQSPTGRGGAQQPPRRRFMRVVKDDNAPPPESIGDNPNIICRYSQEYLTKHYAEVERRRRLDSSRPSLPYTTSGHTILKKSSTDPTNDRSDQRAPSTTMKHTTFCDVVTVVNSDVGDVHEEPLRQTAVDDDVGVEENSPSQTGFFLSPTDTDFPAADETDGSAPDSCSAVQKDDEGFEEALSKDDEGFEEALSKDVNSVGLLNIFSTATRLESNNPVWNSEERSKTSSSLRTTKHVKLVDVIAQIRTDDDGERS